MSHHYLLFDGVSYAYPDGHKALNRVSFRITHGEKVALLGANGAGKSTLMLSALGFLFPTEGKIVVGDIPVCGKTLPIVRRTVGIVFQNPDDQLFMPTVEEDVAFGAVNMHLPEAEIERRVVSALEQVGASDLRYTAPYHLSEGQKKRVSIATVLAMEPAVLVLDEPTASLDIAARHSVIEIIEGFSHTCLIATHDMEFAQEVCPRAILLNKGTVAADGATRDILSDKRLLAECGLAV